LIFVIDRSMDNQFKPGQGAARELLPRIGASAFAGASAFLAVYCCCAENSLTEYGYALCLGI
jgi:hypothetical protein